jgi:hypothetical protein
VNLKLPDALFQIVKPLSFRHTICTSRTSI